MSRPDFYDDATYAELVARIGRLTADATPEWGAMSPAQTLAHCAEVVEVAGGRPLENTPWYVRLLGPLIRKLVLSDRPYPRSTKTHPQYIISETREFEAERQRLLDELARQKASGPEEGTPHPLFGTMTAEEKGWSTFKHLDHHLRQFGV